MKTQVKTIKLKIKKPLQSYKIGSIVTIAVDRNGRVVSKYWSERIGDAQRDGCVEIISEKPQSKKQVPKS